MKKRILIVDDDGTNRYMLETLLNGYGFEVTSAENGGDALDKAILNPPDLIVSDILMPVMDGYNLCRKWKSHVILKHIPFAFYTATYTGSQNEDFALSLGAERFIVKPKEPDILVNILKELLEENYIVKQVAAKPLEEEMEFFRQYNEILFKKLEKKMQDLETTNRKLRVSEESYRRTFMNASDVIYTVDHDLILRSISPSVERVLGYKVHDFVDRPVTEFGRHVLTSESFERAVADVAAILGGQTIASTVYEFIAKDGTIKYGEVSGSPLMREGEIIGIVSVARDITDRKQAEDLLRDSKELFTSFMRYSPVYIYIKEVTPTESRVLQASDNYEQMIGIPGPKMIGRSMVELFPPEFAKKITDDDWAVVSLGNALQLDEDFNGRHYTSIKFPIRQKSKTLLAGYTVDITDRKRAEEALLERDIRFKKLSFHVPGMIYQFMRRQDGTYCVPFSTEAIKDIFGCSPEDVREDFSPITRVVLPEDLNILIKSIEASAEHMTTWQCEYRVQIPGQPIRWMFGLSTPENQADGSVIWHGFNMDVTDRKRTEKALQESEEQYRTLFENVSEAIFVTQDARLVFVNPMTVTITGYSGEELASSPFTDFIHADDRDMVMDRYVRRLKGEHIPPRYSFRVLHKKGGFRWVELDAVIINWKGRPASLNFMNDITERKRVEEKEKETQALLRIAGEKAKLGGWIVNLEENRVIWSDEVAVIHEMPPGYSPTVEQGISFYAPEWKERITKVFSDCAQKGMPYDEEMEIITAGGKRVWVKTIGEAVKNDAGKIVKVQGAFQDITERKWDDEKLQQTLESLRKAVGTTIQVMVSAVEARDPYTAGHQIRSADLAQAIAKEMGLHQEKIEGLRVAASIHDIGKLSIPAEILSKPTKLTNIEFSLIKEHSQSGYQMVKNVESPWPLAEIVYQHHERMDGSGYPRKLKGDDILIEARIMAVADVVEAMASHRPYRPAWGIEEALKEIEKNKGILYDDVVANACLSLFREKGFQF